MNKISYYYLSCDFKSRNWRIDSSDYKFALSSYMRTYAHDISDFFIAIEIKR